MSTNARHTTGKRIKQRIAAVLAAIALMVGVSLFAATPAQAAEWKCEGPRCSLSLNKKETKMLADGGVPMNTPGGQWGLVWQFAVLGHKPFLIQYANRGWCTKFTLSIAPWETQGLTGHRC